MGGTMGWGMGLIAPLVLILVCTEILRSGVVVVKSAKDGV
jgi:hypothetical protein